MKTKSSCFLILTILIIIIGSCRKEVEDKTYSCDSEINNWVKSNQQVLNDFTLQQVINESYEKQKAIFNAISPARRLALWQDKFSIVLTLKWTTEERHHIELLRDFISIAHFSDPSELSIIKAHKTRDEFFRTWIYFGHQKLGWSYPLLASLVLRLDTPQKEGVLLESNNITDGPPSPPPASNPCKCSSGSDWCDAWGGPEGECIEGQDGCEDSTLGCGTLWASACDGKCSLAS